MVIPSSTTVLTTNNATNNDTLVEELYMLLEKFNFPGEEGCTCCGLHILNLISQIIFYIFDSWKKLLLGDLDLKDKDEVAEDVEEEIESKNEEEGDEEEEEEEEEEEDEGEENERKSLVDDNKITAEMLKDTVEEAKPIQEVITKVSHLISFSRRRTKQTIPATKAFAKGEEFDNNCTSSVEICPSVLRLS
jgi:hypothetical protein